MAQALRIFCFFCWIVWLTSCQNEIFQPKKVLVTLHTPAGDMKLLLHEDTPKHRDNFLKLIKKGFYDSAAFNRLLPDFFMEGGSAEPSRTTLPPIKSALQTAYFHRKGALVAVKQMGIPNEQNQSDGSRFYIVQGRVYEAQELDQMAREANYALLAPLMVKMLAAGKYPELNKQADSLKQIAAIEEMKTLILSCEKQIEASFGKQPLRKFSKEQYSVYATEGGLPMFDGQYTIFGQVVEGFEVLDSLMQTPTNRLHEPLSTMAFTIDTEKITKEDYMARYGRYIQQTENDTLYESPIIQ